jgi:hypothetical protein
MKLREEFEKYWKTPSIKDHLAVDKERLHSPSTMCMQNRKNGAYHVFVAAFEMGLNAAKELPPLPEFLKEQQ